MPTQESQEKSWLSFFMPASDPAAVPEKIIGLTLILNFFDRCHSLGSLYLPPAALGSLPTGLLRTA